MSEASGVTNSTRKRGPVYLATFASLLGLAACGSLIGVEEVHDDPSSTGDAGAAGTSQMANGGNTTSGGASAMAGKGGLGSSAGSGSGSGGAGTQGGDRDPGADAGAAGVGGSAGAGSPVHGRVIDYWRHPLANVSVEVAGKTVTTAADGSFAFDDVTDEYDTSLVVRYEVEGSLKTRAWVFQGLTRRNPTLQIYEGSTNKKAYIDILPTGPNLADSRTLSVSLAGPDGSTQVTNVSAAGTNGSLVSWQGPDTTQETAHALVWESDLNSGFPSKFVAFDSTAIGVANTEDATAAHPKASLDLSDDTIAAGTIVGTVVGTGFVDRFNGVFLRYTSNAVINVVYDAPKVAGFSYLVPSIPNASATIVAGFGDASTELGEAHKDGLVPNSSGISVTIPTPARALKLTPSADVGKVSSTTQFDFTASDSATGPFVVLFISQEPSDHDDVLHVVTSKTSFKLPKVVNGAYSLKPGGIYSWRVETHGAVQNVDALADSDGFLDSLSNIDLSDGPTGPRTGDGMYTLSKSVKVTIAP